MSCQRASSPPPAPSTAAISRLIAEPEGHKARGERPAAVEPEATTAPVRAELLQLHNFTVYGFKTDINYILLVLMHQLPEGRCVSSSGERRKKRERVSCLHDLSLAVVDSRAGI